LARSKQVQKISAWSRKISKSLKKKSSNLNHTLKFSKIYCSIFLILSIIDSYIWDMAAGLNRKKLLDRVMSSVVKLKNYLFTTF